MQTEETKNSVDVLKAFVIHALHQTCAEINPFVRLEMIRRYKDFLEGLPDEVPCGTNFPAHWLGRMGWRSIFSLRPAPPWRRGTHHLCPCPSPDRSPITGMGPRFVG